MGALLLPSALAGLVSGIVAGDALSGATANLQLVAIGAVPLAAAGLLLRWRPLAVIGIVIVAATVGAWRGAVVALPTGEGTVVAAVGAEERALAGTAIDDPRPRGERQQVVIDRVEVERSRRRDHRPRRTRPALAAAQRGGAGR